MSVVDDLKAARAELINRGRCRGTLYDGEKVCLLGAIGGAVYGEEWIESASLSLGDEIHAMADLEAGERPSAMLNALAEYLPDGYTLDSTTLWEYNDLASTTDDDVIELFDRAIAKLSEI